MYQRCRVNAESTAKSTSAGAATPSRISKEGMRSAPSFRKGAKRYKKTEIEESGGMGEFRRRSSWRSESSGSSSSLEKSNAAPVGVVSSTSGTRMSAAVES